MEIFYLYLSKRCFVFLDEWLFYILLLYLWFNRKSKNISLYLIFGILIFGSFAIITSYKNLEILERKMNFDPGYLFWPFF